MSLVPSGWETERVGLEFMVTVPEEYAFTCVIPSLVIP